MFGTKSKANPPKFPFDQPFGYCKALQRGSQKRIASHDDADTYALGVSLVTL